MILADKITDLRKKNGWSQEELAHQLGVSRQAVSKWESAASIPDLDKILKMSALFGVSTDYLLKDALEAEEPAPDSAESLPEPADPGLRTVTLEEANTYLSLTSAAAPKTALGVSLCILSPVVQILLAGLSDAEGGYAIPEGIAVAVGLGVLLLMVSAAVALFILQDRKLERYEYLEKEPLDLAYGVQGMVEKEQRKYDPLHSRRTVLGVVLCILSVIPLVTMAVYDDGGMLSVVGVAALLMLVAAGVYQLVLTDGIYESFQKLLEEGDYTRKKKQDGKRNEPLAQIYWCIVLAAYLGWSFVTMDWEHTWILWPVAAVLYGAVLGVSSLLGKHSAQN